MARRLVSQPTTARRGVDTVLIVPARNDSRFVAAACRRPAAVSARAGWCRPRRSAGIGPKFLKLCGRVLYRQADIEAYEEASLVRKVF